MPHPYHRPTRTRPSADGLTRLAEYVSDDVVERLATLGDDSLERIGEEFEKWAKAQLSEEFRRLSMELS